MAEREFTEFVKRKTAELRDEVDGVDWPRRKPTGSKSLTGCL